MTTATHPEFSFPVNYTAASLPDSNDGQVFATIDMMRRYSVEDAGRPEFVAALSKFNFDGVTQQGASGPETPCELAYRFAKHIFRFQRDETTGGPLDPNVVEVLVRPIDAVLLRDKSGEKVPGDCDCFSMLVACCLRVMGVPSAFATISADSFDPSAYSHVYVVAWPGDPDKRTVVDASHGPSVGWEAPNLGRYSEWPLSGGAGNALTILGFLLAALGIACYLGVR